MAQDAIDFLQSLLILYGVIIYLLITLMAFFIGIMTVYNNINIIWIKNLPDGNKIYFILIKLFKYWSKSSFMFFMLNWISLILIVTYSTYYLNRFIENFDSICNIYVNTNK